MKSDLRSNFWGSTSLQAPSALVVTMCADLGVALPCLRPFVLVLHRWHPDVWEEGQTSAGLEGKGAISWDFDSARCLGEPLLVDSFLKTIRFGVAQKSSFFGLGKNCALWNQSCVVQNWWTWCKTNRVHMVFFGLIRSGCHIRYFVQSRISYLPNSMILVIHIWISVWIIWYIYFTIQAAAMY